MGRRQLAAEILFRSAVGGDEQALGMFAAAATYPAVFH